ncbi:MAG: thiamine pyrophosphate-binding protein [Actinobacteria bacterium]|nr:thiamine pyrophosphate-binding protein [Actinomycetota bacterium]
MKTLENHDTELVFGFIGHGTHEIADSMTKAGLRTVNPATELGGAWMMNAYNYLRGRSAAVGAWHTVGTLLLHPALMEAMASRIPSLHLGFNNDSRMSGRDGAIQQVPLETFTPLTRWAGRVNRIDKIAEAVQIAFHGAEGVPAGPSFLDIPMDVATDISEIVVPSERSVHPTAPQAADDDVREAAAQLLAAERPVIIVGGGAVLGDAGEEIRSIVELTGIPFVTTSTAQGLVSEEHPLCMGPAGMAGWRSANETLAEADFALVIGSRLSDWGIAQGFYANLPSKIVQVDVDPAQLGEFYLPRLSIVADAKSFTKKLVEALPQTSGFDSKPFEDREISKQAIKRRQSWLDWVEETGKSGGSPLSQWRIMAELRGILDADDILVSDIGNHSIPTMAGAINRQPHRLLSSFGEGVLGCAFPMGIGAKLAEPDTNVVVASGDGALQYHFNEMRVAIEHKTPMTVVLFNNNSYGANHGMMSAWYGSPSWTEFANPDWTKLFEAYGGDGEKIDDADDLGKALERGRESATPYIIDVPVDAFEPFPENQAVGPAMLIKGRELPGVKDSGIVVGEHLVIG